jgi:ATP-dependent RNA helicase RhlE
MLDMGFLPTIERIVAALPVNRQTLFFSATIQSCVRHLVDTHVPGGIRIEVGSTTKPAGQIDLRLYEVEQNQKLALLHRLLQQDEGSFLEFARTKHGAERLARRLVDGGVKTAALHGDCSQNQRNQALRGFQAGAYRVLVATDVASRGIHVDGISLVVNYDLPQVVEGFIHRVGRTGRAGARGDGVHVRHLLGAEYHSRHRTKARDSSDPLYRNRGGCGSAGPYCFATPAAVAALYTWARKAHPAYGVGVWRCL